MRQPFTTHSYTLRSVKAVSKWAILLLFVFIASTGCKKGDELATRELEIGTQCNIYKGVFLWGDKQPAVPVTVVSVYRGASSGLIYYNVQDAKGEMWVIPDNDLQVIK